MVDPGEWRWFGPDRFVTLTTLGFGDIVPTSDLARSLVTLEAVPGQVLLVTLVAPSVSTLGQTRQPV